MISINRAVEEVEKKEVLCQTVEVVRSLDSSVSEYSKDVLLLNRKRLTDEKLGKLFAEDKDEESFNEIVSRCADNIYRIALRFTNNHSDAEEVVQDVLLAIYKNAKTFRGESKFTTWLYRLTVNAALTKLRQRRKEKEIYLDDYMPKFQNDGHHLVRPVIDWSQDVDKLVSNKEFHHIVEQAIDELWPVDRAVVVMSDLEEMSAREISEVLDLSLLAVKARPHRARLFLRGKLATSLGY